MRRNRISGKINIGRNEDILTIKNKITMKIHEVLVRIKIEDERQSS
jgi:hypothetical protein